MQPSPHISVLLNEVLQTFASIESGIIIDCTLGFGGHSQALLEQNPNIKIIGIDKDIDARDYSTRLLEKYGERFECVAGGFGAQILPLIEKYGSEIKGVLADIGVSSWQLDSPSKGFGFDSQMLDMRMDRDNPLTAEYILKHYSTIELSRVFSEYGELREAKKLASLINEDRKKLDFSSAKDFSHYLKTHFKNPKILPLVYQALRIEVNGELEELKSLLDAATKLQNATLCIITFHSLEDRLVKQAFRDYAQSCICPASVLRCTCGNHHQKGILLAKRPIIPSTEEVRANPRARSAKMRSFLFQ